MNRGKPASIRLALGLLAVGLAGVLAFSLLLYRNFAVPRVFDTRGYSTEPNEVVVYEVWPSVADGMLTLDGWALEAGPHVTKVDVWLLLYDAETGEYLRLPTAMVRMDGLHSDNEYGHTSYIYGGFTSRVKLARLAKDLDEYEVCIAFAGNLLRVLVHTGEAPV